MIDNIPKLECFSEDKEPQNGQPKRKIEIYLAKKNQNLD